MARTSSTYPHRRPAPRAAAGTADATPPDDTSSDKQTMNQILPWQALGELVEPYQPKQHGPGRPAKPLLEMVNLYLSQSAFTFPIHQPKN